MGGVGWGGGWGRGGEGGGGGGGGGGWGWGWGWGGCTPGVYLAMPGFSQGVLGLSPFSEIPGGVTVETSSGLLRSPPKEQKVEHLLGFRVS